MESQSTELGHISDDFANRLMPLRGNPVIADIEKRLEAEIQRIIAYHHEKATYFRDCAEDYGDVED